MSDVLNNRRQYLQNLTIITGECVTILDLNGAFDEKNFDSLLDYRWFSLSSRGDNPNARIRIKITFNDANFIEQEIFAGDAYNLDLNKRLSQITSVRITELTSNSVHVVYNLVTKRL